MLICFFSISDNFNRFHRKAEILALQNELSKKGGRAVYFTRPKFIFSKRDKSEAHGDIGIYHLFCLLPLSLALKSPWLMKWFVKYPVQLQLNRVIKSLGLKDDVIYWIYKPDQYLYAVDKAKPFVYLHYDNYGEDASYTFNQHPSFNSALNASLSDARLALCSSANLRNELLEAHPNVDAITYYPNAVSRSLLPEGAEANKESDKAKSKVVIGFIGQLDDTFDHILLESLLLAYPDYSFMMVGPVTNQAVVLLASKFKHLELVGAVPYESLNKYLSLFDLGLCPYSQSQFNRYRNPLKIYEYFLHGIAVVSVACDIDPSAKKLLSVAQTQDDFISSVASELQADSEEKIKQRIRFAQSNCWDNRAAFICDALSQGVN